MKKITYFLILSILIIFPLCSCYESNVDVSSQTSSPTPTDSSENSSVNDNNSSSDSTSTLPLIETHKYDSEHLIYVSKQNDAFKPDKNKKYTYIDGFGSFESNKDGSLFINGYVVSDFIGEVIYFYKNPIDKCLIVFSHNTDGKVYLNSYNTNGDKCVYNNTAVTFKKQNSSVIYSKVNKIKFSNTATAGFVVEINGKYYHNKLNLSLGNEPSFELIAIDKCKTLYGLGYRNPYSVVCYSKKDVYDSVFYKCGSIEYSIQLPDGYKTNNIKELYFGNVVVIEFDDEKICTVSAGRYANSYLSTINEVITSLKKSKNILKIYPITVNGNIEIYADMDDGKVYKMIA